MEGVTLDICLSALARPGAIPRRSTACLRGGRTLCGLGDRPVTGSDGVLTAQHHERMAELARLDVSRLAAARAISRTSPPRPPRQNSPDRSEPLKEPCMAHRILVADDDPHIREVICFALEKAGMVTRVGADGAAALAAVRAQPPDLVVLDVGMPEMDGLEVCRQLRRTSDVPILFLSARDEEIDRILGLEMGGDDYVTKPFSPRELVARVNVILRRARTAPATTPRRDAFAHGRLALDPEQRMPRLSTAGGSALTAIEFAILKSLLASGRRMCSRATS